MITIDLDEQFQKAKAISSFFFTCLRPRTKISNIVDDRAKNTLRSLVFADFFSFNKYRMKNFVPGIIVGILLVLLYIERQPVGQAKYLHGFEEGKKIGHDMGFQQARKLCELEKQTLFEDAYGEGYRDKEAECERAQREDRSHYEALMADVDHEWKMKLSDTLLVVRKDLIHAHEEELSVLRKRLKNLESQRRAAIQPAPEIMKQIRHGIVVLSGILICIVLYTFVRQR